MSLTSVEGQLAVKTWKINELKNKSLKVYDHEIKKFKSNSHFGITATQDKIQWLLCILIMTLYFHSHIARKTLINEFVLRFLMQFVFISPLTVILPGPG